MTKYKVIISQAIDLASQHFVGMDSNTIAEFRPILKEQAKLIIKELRYNGEGINPDILAARLDEFTIQMKDEHHQKDLELSSHDFPIFNVSHNPTMVDPNPINGLHNNRHLSYVKQPSFISEEKIDINQTSQQTPIDWYFIKPSATYYSSMDGKSTPSIHRSHSRSTIRSELHPLTNSNSQKILVNVINDNTSNIYSRKSSLKSHKKEKIIKKKLYNSPNTVIGSQTVEELYQVVNNQKSAPSRTTSIAERVIIIDRPENNKTVNEKDRFRVFEIHSSNPPPAAPSTEYITQQPTYYNHQQVVYQQPTMYMSLPSNIYSTSYVANPNTFYPYVYYQY